MGGLLNSRTIFQQHALLVAYNEWSEAFPRLLLKPGSVKSASQRAKTVHERLKHGRHNIPIEAAIPLNAIDVGRELCLYHDDGAERRDCAVLAPIGFNWPIGEHAR